MSRPPLPLRLICRVLPIYLGPAQGEALGLALAGGADEVEQRRIVVPHRGVEAFGFVFVKLADALVWLFEHMLSPNRLAIEADAPDFFRTGEQSAQQFDRMR